MRFDPTASNPLRDNPLRTRADVERAVSNLFQPLIPYFSAAGARVRLDPMAATYDRSAADLEGFARPLWGLAPLAVCRSEDAYWELYRRGIASGTDPRSPGYWGEVGNCDQRLVELAAIGFAMRLVPERIWDPLDPSVKQRLAQYLQSARSRSYFDNNWKFFRIMVDLGLEQCGIAFDRSMTETYLDELDGFHMGEGWYSDGRVRRADHYVPFALHFYGLIYAQLGRDRPRAETFRSRARRFAQDFTHWFDEDGGALVFGRSLTYRFACAGFWGALAFAGVDALPWGEIKGYYLRHLRWWRQYPIAHRDGILAVGYGYPNIFMSESYNTAGSAYWAFKAFLPLALPDTHPFWQADERPAATRSTVKTLPHPGMVMMRTPGNAVALSSGQHNLQMRAGTEKYAKFVYSSRYGFSIEVDERGYGQGAFDGALALSEDGRHYRVREANIVAKVAGPILYALWRPWADVAVETWLIPRPPWHIRVHRITTPRPLHGTEGGFAIARSDGAADRCVSGPSRASAENETDLSLIVDIGEDARQGRAHAALPNTNLLFPKTTIPQLLGAIPLGTGILMTAVLALPRSAVTETIIQPPAAPDLLELEKAVQSQGQSVSIMAWEG